MRDKQVAGCLSQINCVTVGGIISVPRPSSYVSLSEILETQEGWLKRNPGKTPQDWTNYIRKFFLSPRAASGILRRAKARGKDVPEMLHRALLQVAEGQSEPERAEGKTRLSPAPCKPVSDIMGTARRVGMEAITWCPFDEWIAKTADWGGTWTEWAYIYLFREQGLPTMRDDWGQAYRALLEPWRRERTLAATTAETQSEEC